MRTRIPEWFLGTSESFFHFDVDDSTYSEFFTLSIFTVKCPMAHSSWVPYWNAPGVTHAVFCAHLLRELYEKKEGILRG